MVVGRGLDPGGSRITGGGGSVEGMDDDEETPRKRDLTREMAPVLAAVIVVLAAIGEPARWPYVLAIALTVPVFAAWSREWLPTPVVTVVVALAVTASQLSGDLEPAFFLLSLLGLVITGWERLTALSVMSVAIVLATPAAVVLLYRAGHVSWGIWMIGIAFPACMGYVFHRQEVLAHDLAEARRALAEQTVLEERRRIARDVHDLVGHGLAAMMLQVTSARHVLRRDLAAAEEALEAAENAGRESMQQLRHTVALLREGDSAVAVPPPGVCQLDDLAASARGRGLDVAYRAVGDHSRLDTVQGLALYRIVQESLANASRHSPDAATVVTTTVEDCQVLLTVDTVGPLQPHAGDDVSRPRYGLRGMRERAEAVGGVFQAGPTPAGWSVRCRVPLVTERAEAVQS